MERSQNNIERRQAFLVHVPFAAGIQIQFNGTQNRDAAACIYARDLGRLLRHFFFVYPPAMLSPFVW